MMNLVPNVDTESNMYCKYSTGGYIQRSRVKMQSRAGRYVRQYGCLKNISVLNHHNQVTYCGFLIRSEDTIVLNAEVWCRKSGLTCSNNSCGTCAAGLN